MKNRIIILAAIAILAAFNGSAQQKKWTEAEASALIGYGNELIELYNRNVRIEDNIDDTYNTYNTNKDNLSKNEGTSVQYMGCRNFLDLISSNKIPAAPAFYPDKTVEADFMAAEDFNKKIQSHCEAIQKYFEEKQFIGDQFAKSDKLIEEMAAYWDSAYHKMTLAVRRASKISNNAEMVFIQKDPNKHLIIPMKTDLNTINEFIQEMSGSTDFTGIRQKLATIRATVEKNKVVEGKDFSKKDIYYKLEVYPAFYRSLLSAISGIESYLDKAEANKNDPNVSEMLRGNLEEIYSGYNSAIANYNTFIR